MALAFRKLRADEIDIRAGQIRDTYATLLLYKDARCDMNILDETVGAMNWTRQHSRENANCTVSIWDAEKAMWISKEDTGTESNTEAEKGLASDSFKRACVNWGIGRELYTAPFIKVKNGQVTIVKSNTGRLAIKEKLVVKTIEYSGNSISRLEIATTDGDVVYAWPEMVNTQRPAQPQKPTVQPTVTKSATVAPAYNPVPEVEAIKARFHIDAKGFAAMRQSLIDGGAVPNIPSASMTEADWKQLFHAIEANFGDAA